MKKFNYNLAIAAIAVLFFASCSTEQAVFTSSDETTTERIDMVIDGNDQENIFLQTTNDNSLVDYNFYGSGSNQFDIRLNLDAERTLVIKLVDETSTDLWAHEGGYSMYATRDLEDKQRFVTVELIDGSEITSYRSNIDEVFPQGTYVNVFNIQDFNPANNELFARIIDMPLMSTTDQEVLTINGTFRGTVNF